MNLYLHGPHLSADWLLYKVRARHGQSVALYLRDDGQLIERNACYRPKLPDGQQIGVYRLNGFSVRQAREDLTEYWQARHNPKQLGVGIVRGAAS